MNRQERQPDRENLMRLVQDDLLRRLRCSTPGIVESVDLAMNTCTVQPCIQEPIPLQTGDTKTVALPLLVDVPIVSFKGGGIVLTMPLEQGDEVLVIFGDRCIDAWWQSGGVQPQAEIRFHDLSDGFAIPGPFSLANVPPNISSSSAQLRTQAGTAYVELTKTGVINLVGPVNITGMLTVNGNVETTGTLLNNNVDVGSDHVHVSGAEGSDTGIPKMGP
jgi:hypothetical protein